MTTLTTTEKVDSAIRAAGSESAGFTPRTFEGPTTGGRAAPLGEGAGLDERRHGSRP